MALVSWLLALGSWFLAPAAWLRAYRRSLRFSAAGRLLAAGCCFYFFLPAAAAADDDYPTEVRKYDEVYFRDSVKRGTLSKVDGDPDKLNIKDYNTGSTRTFSLSEATKINCRQTPESNIAEAIKRTKEKSNPKLALKFAQYAVGNYGSVFTPKIIALLELEIKSKDPDLLAFLADLYLQTGRAKDTLDVAETLVSLFPQRASSFMLRGQALQELGKMEEAGKDLAKAYNMAQQDTRVIIAYATYLLNTGRSEQAKGMFDKALADNPRNTAALVGLGLVQLRQGEFSEAEKSFNTAMQINADLKQAAIGLASVKLMTKQYNDAYLLAEKLLDKNTKCWEAYALEALVKLYAGDKDSLDMAEKKIKDSLDEKSDQPRLLQAWAAELERQAQYAESAGGADAQATAKTLRDQAAAKYDELFALNPPDACLQYFMGEKKFRAGDNNGALSAFQRAAQLAPRYAPAHAALGATYLRREKWDEARTAYKTAQELAPSAAEYYAGQGLALLKPQRFDEAENLFVQACRCDANNISALCGLGYIKNYKRDKPGALFNFQQALAVDGACAYAADALKKLYAQEDMLLEYLSVTDKDPPDSKFWHARPSGTVKVAWANGQIVFSGKQGAAQSGVLEYYKEIKADDFVRLDADLEIAPASQVCFGLRLGSGAGSGTTFEVEFGKDESNQIKFRYKDYHGQPPDWKSTSIDWPASGKVRLGLETEDLKKGKLLLSFNGKKSEKPLELDLQRPTRVTVGFFLQAMPNETVRAAVSNVALVARGLPSPDEKNPNENLFQKKDEEKKPADK